MPARRLPLLSLLAACAATLTPAVAGAAHVANSAPDTGNWTTGGTANDVVRVGDRVYVGGDFDAVGPRTGPLASLDATTGAVVPGLPYVDGATAATIPDGSGGWYVGGGFEQIGGVSRDNLAHVTAAGTIDTAFVPQLDGVVMALALSPDGDTLYAAGGFDAAGGLARPGAVALDADSGAVRTGWDAGFRRDDAVVAIAADDDSVYVGGSFPAAGGQTRANLAQLDADSGAATPWNPAPDASVLELLLTGGTLYVGGSYALIEGQGLSYASSFDASGPTPILNAGFAPVPDTDVKAIAVGNGNVYLGGPFSTAGGQPRAGVAAVDPATGAALPGWDAGLEGGSHFVDVGALAVSGGHVYIGGRFAGSHGDPRTNLAQVRVADGFPTDWAAVAGRGVTTLTPHAGGVVTGGTLDTVGGVPRRNLAAFDATDGTVTGWDPGADDEVHELAAGPDGTIYAGGIFSTVGGQPRPLAAALDPASGNVTAWDPQPGGVVFAIAATADAVFLGGDFGNVGPEPRNRLAAVSPSDGAPLPWRADAEGGSVTALAVHGSTLFAAGPDVTEIGGVRRRSVAALDVAGAAVLPFDPFVALPERAPASIRSLAIDDDRLVLGGAFEQIHGEGGPQPRGNVAVYDLGGATAALLPGDASADEPVDQVGVHGDAVYVAGSALTALGGQPRDGAGAFDAETGDALPWEPQGVVAQRLSVADDGTVYATGAVASDERAGDVGSFSMAPAALDGPALGQSAPGTVRCDLGRWDGTRPMTFSYAWARDGAAVPAVTTADFPATSREGLACTVTAANRGGTTDATASVARTPAPPPPPGPGPSAPAAIRPLPRLPAPRRPRARLRSLPGRVFVRRGVAAIVLRCRGEVGRCSGTLRLKLRVPAARGRGRAGRRARTLVLGSTSYSLPPGGRTTVRIRLSRAGLARLLAAPRRRLLVTATAGGGIRRPLALRAAAPPRRGR